VLKLEPRKLEGHKASVSCMVARGPCLFTSCASLTVHVYDLSSGDLLMRILGHPQPVTCIQSQMQDTSKSWKELNGPCHINFLCPGHRYVC